MTCADDRKPSLNRDMQHPIKNYQKIFIGCCNVSVVEVSRGGQKFTAHPPPGPPQELLELLAARRDVEKDEAVRRPRTG